MKTSQNEITPSQEKVLQEIQQSIDRNDSLQNYQHNTKLLRDDNLWIQVKNRKKQSSTSQQSEV